MVKATCGYPDLRCRGKRTVPFIYMSDIRTRLAALLVRRQNLEKVVSQNPFGTTLGRTTFVGIESDVAFHSLRKVVRRKPSLCIHVHSQAFSRQCLPLVTGRQRGSRVRAVLENRRRR